MSHQHSLLKLVTPSLVVKGVNHLATTASIAMCKKRQIADEKGTACCMCRSTVFVQGVPVLFVVHVVQSRARLFKTMSLVNI